MNPGPSTSGTITGTEKWEKELHDYQLYTRVCRATIEFIQKMYQESGVLLDLEDKSGTINDEPVNIIQYLWKLVPKAEKEREIIKLKKILNEEYDPDELVQKYLTKLQETRKNLTTLEADPGTPKMIRQAVCAFEQHTELEKVMHDWQKKSDTIQKQWKEMKKKKNHCQNPSHWKQPGNQNSNWICQHGPTKNQ